MKTHVYHCDICGKKRSSEELKGLNISDLLRLERIKSTNQNSKDVCDTCRASIGKFIEEAMKSLKGDYEKYVVGRK